MPQGVYVTRNSDTYFYGQMELSDNVAYGNGINGVVFHRTDRGVVQRNTVYDNGVVPRFEYEQAVLEDWMINLSKSRQPYSGIVLNSAEEVKLWSNNVSARYETDFAFNTVEDGGATPPPLAAGGNNRVCKGLVSPELESVVGEESDLSVCSRPSSQPTPQPTTLEPTIVPTVAPKYVEISCGNKCHLIQWPYDMRGSYIPSEAYEECEADCDDGDCKAFSLQDDYRPDFSGYKRCFLYKASKEPFPEICANDPFSHPFCTYATSGGSFFVTPAARALYNVQNL